MRELHSDEQIIATMQDAINGAMYHGIISLSELAGVLFHAIRAAGKSQSPTTVVQYVRCATVLYEHMRARTDSHEDKD